MSARTHATLLLLVARRAIGEARAAWRAWNSTSDIDGLRAAYQKAVTAAKATRDAGEAFAKLDSKLSKKLIADTENLDAAVAELSDMLVKMVIDPPSDAPPAPDQLGAV